jgi:hypothetical protein
MSLLDNLALLLDPTKPMPERTSCAECGKPMTYAIRYRLCNNCLVPLDKRIKVGAVLRKHRPDTGEDIAPTTRRRKTRKKA